MSILPVGWHIGPIALDDSGPLGILLAFVVFLYVGKREFAKRGGDGDKLTDALCWMGAAWVFTPRLLSFLYAPAESFAHPILTLVNGEVPYGGWLGATAALLAGVWWQRKHRFPLWAAGEAVAKAFVCGFVVYALCYAEAGMQTSLPWAVTLGESTYHPLNLYQALLALLILALRRSGYLSLGLLGGGLLLLSLLQVHPHTQFGLASVQWLWLLLTAVGLLNKSEKAA
ncbi:prolipoprotein diacylglyceryltransferase [Tumebacillus sp. BK434]|uniref:prolipoprotein diacylglyceryl transferase family protein n=1 Tax=Tumebacillus sp. BK434 TaxID=2512169 RepID=UPI001045B3B1|nr:prolipoprotein diacylglyceryl transferase family protein [Tumebacillus sp. BK434]TCP55521.1 prolipoprotein diacylglyceryltransferase [Tumebacillus sp. BK434]